MLVLSVLFMAAGFAMLKVVKVQKDNWAVPAELRHQTRQEWSLGSVLFEFLEKLAFGWIGFGAVLLFLYLVIQIQAVMA